MIKVNLLKDQTAQVRKSFVQPKVSRTGLTFLAIFVLAAAAMGTWTLYIRHQVQAARLQVLRQEIVKYQKLKQIRQNRIDVIEKLKENQKGPVLLLNSVIQSIPKDGDLWLTSLNQVADQIKIVGFTQRTEVIPDFMVNLSATGFFQSVDLEVIERQKEASKFSLICVSLTKPQAE
jgi:Tfp pilus assembly protein PilN